MIKSVQVLLLALSLVGLTPCAVWADATPETVVLPAPLSESPNPIPPDLNSPSVQRPWFGVHAALGFPNPAQVGLDFVDSSESFAVSVRGGTTQRIQDNIEVRLKNLEAQFRYHPWSTAFFYGLALGRRSAAVEKTEIVSNQSVKATVEATSNYLTPQVGWVWIFNNGLNLGFELGYQMPLNPAVQFASDADATLTSQSGYRNLEKDVVDQGDYLSQLALPHVTLVRLGWSF